jgi:hypothetical protein
VKLIRDGKGRRVLRRPCHFASISAQIGEIRPSREIVLSCIFVYALFRAEDVRFQVMITRFAILR